MTSVTSPSTQPIGRQQPPNAVVKYFGRATQVLRTEQNFVVAAQKLVEIKAAINTIATNNGDKNWQGLNDDVSHLANYLFDPDRKLMRYQLELLQEGILPYLGSLKGRIHIDNKRFKQIRGICSAVVNHDVEHPAVLLQEMDSVLVQIRSESGLNLWKSELQSALQSATDKQWSPIIADNRAVLQDFGGKLLMLGLIGVVGWPVALLYPLYKLVLTLLQITKEWEQTKRLTRQSMFELVKTVAMLYAAQQVLFILGTYVALGHTCLLLGGAALAVSFNTQSIKFAAPILAPHLVQIDFILSEVSRLDFSTMMSAGQQSAGLSNAGQSSDIPTVSASSRTYTSDRVEVLQDNSEGTSGRSTATNSGTPDIGFAEPVPAEAEVSVEYVEATPIEAHTAGAEVPFGIRRRFGI